MKHSISILFFLFWVCVAFGQEVLENNPPSVKWRKIKTPHFKVLYPQGFEVQAQRVANTLEHIRDAESKSLGVSTRRFSVILQNQSSVSNGFVSMIPRRSEFFTMPPQDYNFLGTNDWLDQLAAHEYRHIVQYDRANSGFNRILYHAFGPATFAAMASVSVPAWVWEGDAVATETAFTHSGRGRIPNFGLVLRTNLQEGRTFSYNKQYLRSYKHNMSDHYVLGYHMISYLRKRTGDPDVWGKVMKRTAQAPFLPFWFSNSVKKVGGLNLPNLYKATAEDIQKSSEEEIQSLQITPFENLTKRNSKAYTNYKNPQVLSDGSVLVVKSGIGDIEQFVKIKDGKEHKLFTPGLMIDAGMLSVSGNTIVWNESGFDARWLVRSYSVIKTYNIATKKHKAITQKTRYAGAALSPDASKIVTAENDNEYKNALVIIDTTGHVVKKFDNPSNAFYSMARWSPDGKKIVSLKTENGKRSVVLLDAVSGVESEMLAPSYENIGHPVLYGNFLFYNSPVSGIDNIYVFDVVQQKRLQVTSSKYGAYNPAISSDGKIIYYSEQTRDGLSLVSVSLNPDSWKEFKINNDSEELYQVLASQEKTPDLFDNIPQQQYEVKKYSKFSGIINPYSWGAYFNSTFTQADIGISSRDILSTTEIKAGYLYDINERTGAWRAGVSYQGWFPIIDLNVKYGKRSLDEGNLTYLDSDTLAVTENLTFEWTEKNIEAGLRIPLLTTNSRYHGSLTFGDNVGVTQTEDFKNSITGDGRIITPQLPVYWNRELIDNGKLVYNQFYISAFRLLKQSRRDINSKWGQTFDLNLFNTPFGGDYTGKQFSFYTTLYFPGLFKHHSIWGYWGFQSTEQDLLSRTSQAEEFKDKGTYFFRNQIPLPRGVSVFHFEKFYSMSANYTLPLWYPDVALGPVLNIQRFRGNAFVDYGFGSSFTGTRNASSASYLSVGGELKMDINVMRFLQQFNIGVRYSYGIKPSVTNVEFLVGFVNF